MKATVKNLFLNKRFVLLFVILFVLFLFILWYYFPVFSIKTYTNSDFGIANYQSSNDQDGDGVEDQRDILEGAKAYLDTKPKYKSQYYDGGYPTDQYGVCTDVVAFALRHAGYDLQVLVDTDIRENPNAYDIATVDKNIDFRRVKNLLVYFQKNAISLSTDIHKIDTWQGGDIVVFKDHIGVVSDHRNKKGISYVLHHANPFQKKYEEDILQKYTVVGHFRIS